jgi:hypothetical protein
VLLILRIAIAVLFLVHCPLWGAPDLFSAIRADDLKAVQSALKTVAGGNGKNAHGATPLMQAAIHASPAMMKLLIDRGADPNSANPFGATALMWAAGDAAKVKLLLDAGAEVNARPTIPATLKYCVCCSPREPIRDSLIIRGKVRLRGPREPPIQQCSRCCSLTVQHLASAATKARSGA